MCASNDQVIRHHVRDLAESRYAAIALHQHRRGRAQVPVDHFVRDLEIETFVCGRRRHQDADRLSWISKFGHTASRSASPMLPIMRLLVRGRVLFMIGSASTLGISSDGEGGRSGDRPQIE